MFKGRWCKEDRGYRTKCHIWQDCLEWNGYPRVWFEGRNRYVHVLVYGPLLPGQQVDHLCGQRDCIRRSHLEAVSPTENVRRSGATLLTTAQVLAIRNDPRRYIDIAADYGMSRSNVSSIKRRRTWADVG